MLTVLVAENSSPTGSISSILTRHFRDECTICQATNTWEFFRCLWDQPVDIVFLDMVMPGINPEELFRSLQNGEPAARPGPLTAFPLKDTPSILDYTRTPYTEAEVILTIEEELHRRSLSEIHPGLPDRTDLSRIDQVKPRIQAYIAEHYGNILSMQDVARVMNYSDTHFCRLFKQCFQVSFSVYLNNYRVEQAKKLLLSSDLAVKEVGAACGYRDTSYFIRVFKRHTGLTPNDYRTRKTARIAIKSDKS